MSFLDPLELSTADVGHWSELAARASTPNPFFEPSFLLPAVRLLGGGHVRLLVVQDAGGSWVGALPVRRELLWHRLPALTLASWRHPYCYLGAPLLAEGHESRALETLLGVARHRVGILALEQLPLELAERVVQAARERFGAPPVTWSRADRALVCRRDDPAEYLLLRPKRLRELRRQRAALGRELGADLVTTDLAGSSAAVDRFLQLEDAGWKGRARTSMAGAGADEFFRLICANFATRGRLQLLALNAGQRTVAMKCNLIAGEGVFCFKIAHDPALARSSPGVQLELDNVELFRGRAELTWMDSCADPGNQMINRIWPDRRHLCTTLVPGEGMIGRFSRAEAAVASSTRRRLKEHRS